MKRVFSLILALLLLTMGAITVQAAPQINRYYGEDRFGTAIAVAKQLYQTPHESPSAMFVSAYDFPDALSASTLATQLKEPILLMGNGVNDSLESLTYAKSVPIKAFDIVGGIVSPGTDGNGTPSWKVKNWIQQNIQGLLGASFISGHDRFETNENVAYYVLGEDALKANQATAKGVPVVIVNGNEFPDALGIAPVAAANGWPILFCDNDQIPQKALDIIQKDEPPTVYFIGGDGVISQNVISEIHSAVPNASVLRQSGIDRFTTNASILSQFYLKPSQIYLANGYDFPDALAGSTLAAANNAPVILIDPNAKNLLPASIDTYLSLLHSNGINPEINVLGGPAAVPDSIVQKVSDVLENG